MTADVIGIAPSTDGTPAHILLRIGWIMNALATENHVLEKHWDNLPPDARDRTFKQIKRLAYDLNGILVDLEKGRIR